MRGFFHDRSGLSSCALHFRICCSLYPIPFLILDNRVGRSQHHNAEQLTTGICKNHCMATGFHDIFTCYKAIRTSIPGIHFYNPLFTSSVAKMIWLKASSPPVSLVSLLYFGYIIAVSHASILFSGGTVIAFNESTESLQVLRNGSVLVTDDRIAAIFSRAP